MEIVNELIKRHEGFREKPYLCTAGKLTIGYGRNLDDVGITKEEASLLLEKDIIIATNQVRLVFKEEYKKFSYDRFMALVDMMYNLGLPRFKEFKKMIQAIRDNDWEEAAKQALDSDWAKQVQARANEDAELLRKG